MAPRGDKDQFVPPWTELHARVEAEAQWGCKSTFMTPPRARHPLGRTVSEFAWSHEFSTSPYLVCAVGGPCP